MTMHRSALVWVTVAAALAAGQARAAERPLIVEIRVPTEAQVKINGYQTRSVGAVRHYETPPLPTGKSFTYTFTVTYRGKTVTRDLQVRHGAANTFDLRPDFRASAKGKVSPAEFEEIAEEAFIYGFPMVMNYGVMYEYYIDKSSDQYKCPFNQIYNTARVYTPKDKAVVTPNSDTPYSFFCADLRTEPVVFYVPEVEKKRYYSVQLVDMYTFNYGYVGSRTTGNGAGRFMIAGPNWKGEAPAGIKKVFRCETDFTFAVFRTQLFNPADIDNVKRVQAGYQVQTLSAFLKQPAPPAALEIKWPKIDKKSAEADPFAYLNFVLQFCPPVGPAKVEKPLRAKFARIGIEAGKPFDVRALSRANRDALARGMKKGMAKIEERVGTLGKEVNGWRIMYSGFGDRSVYKGDWLLRAAVAKAGIYGNDAAEALYPLLATDSEGEKCDCSKHNYTLTFPKGQLPPVNAFWSVTMYDAKTQLLVANPIHRYLINSPMLPDLEKNPDGSLTIYLQKDSPGKDKESNWLPAPDGPIYVAMRLYWPKKEALDGTWKPPAVMRAAR
jgi:uncharacterized protein (TIGR03000 family)